MLLLLILHVEVRLYWDDILVHYTAILLGLTIISSWIKLKNMRESFHCAAKECSESRKDNFYNESRKEKQ